MKRKRILFLTGTRADFGKIKSLVKAVENHNNFESYLFVTGMHMIEAYGYTLIEVQKSGFKNIYTFSNHTDESTMDLTLAKTIQGFSNYVNKIKPDLIVIHGDRVETLAGAIVGSLNNILVAHIEGGELSGTIDELIRHSVSKLSHIHFVSNEKAAKRLMQMGELESSIITIGSPDIDVMFSNNLPDLNIVKDYYEINFDFYHIVMFHPVTTEFDMMEEYTRDFISALVESKQNFVVIFPNNDLGNNHIIKAYGQLKGNPFFRIYPSLRFEYFLTLLKNANSIIGNSSAGVREAPYYGVPAINIGSRQNKRVSSSNIINTSYNKKEILEAILSHTDFRRKSNSKIFGKGNSAELFLKSILSESIWNINHQKQFKDTYG